MTNDVILLSIVLILQLILAVSALYLKRYVEEKAKNAATKDDIAEITEIQKQIEAKITDEVWDRQMRWTTKKDLYFKLVSAVEEAYDCVSEIVATESKRKGAIMLQHAAKQDTCDQQIAEARQQLIQKISQLRTGAYSLHLITEDAPSKSLQSVVLSLAALSQASILEHDLVNKLYQDVQIARSEFIACAKDDLGFSR